MDSLEVRKARLEFIWKVLAVGITVLGTIIVYFGQSFVSVPNTGEVIFIGVESLCALLLLTGINYVYKESNALQDDNAEKYEKEKNNISTAYDNIFSAVKSGVICFLIQSLCLVIYSMYGIEWMQCFVPTQQHLCITSAISFIALLIPSNKVWELSSKPITQTKEIPNEQNVMSVRNSIKIETDKLRCCRWAAYSVFWFDLWYLITFTSGGV